MRSRATRTCLALLALLSVVIGFAGRAGAAATFVQSTSQSGNAFRNASVATFSGVQTAGNVNVVFIAWQGAASNLLSVSDTAGNTYWRVLSTSYGGTATQVAYYARLVAGAAAGKNTITATFNTKVTNPDLRVVEYGGLDPIKPLDVAGGLGAAAILTSSGPVTTTNANDLLLASNFSQQSITAAGAGFTTKLMDQYSQIVEDRAVTATGQYTATAPQTKSGWFVMQMLALRVADTVAPQVVVPNVIGQTQSAATSALASLGLTAGTATQQSSATIPAGSVISELPAAGASVAAGSAVNLVISSGPPVVTPVPVTVPNAVGATQAAATAALTGAGLAVGSITQQTSSTVTAGKVISQQPAAGSSVLPGSAVNLVISSGPPVVTPVPVTVPNAVGVTQAAAGTAITGAGLVVGSVAQQTSTTVASGLVLSQLPVAGASAVAGSAVNLVVSSGPPVVTPVPVTVPNTVGATQAAASTVITGAGLVVGSVTQQTSASVASGLVVSQQPVAGASVVAGSGVSLVVSSGPPVVTPVPVTVPNAVGATQAAASTAISGAGLVVGSITQQPSTAVASGSVISQQPAAGSSVAAGAAVNLVVSSGAPSLGASPYPASPILAGISWDQSSKQRYASGSDIWDSMWASDGQVYGVWGDGNGFSAPAKKQIGVSRLSGSPADGTLAGSDIYLGSPSPRVAPCAQKSTLGGKPHGVLALPNAVMYMFHSTYDLCTSTAVLARSMDNGVTWTDNVGGSWPDANGFSPVTVLQYGAGQAGALAPDSTDVPYLYIYASKANAGSQYLARVPAFPSNAIETAANWSYFAGTDGSGNPRWAASSAQAQPVWTDANYSESLGVTFNPALGRYIAYNDHGNDCGGSPCERQVSLFDSPSPWGPWTTFDYEEQFDNTGCGANCLGSQEAVGWAMMQKWFSPDGLSLWVQYSSLNAYDSLNLIKGTIGLAPGSTVTNLKVSSGAAAVVDRLSMSDPGNLEFIDRMSRLTSIPAAYRGLEVIRLARNDAANSDPNFLSFTSTAAQNVCVGWNAASAPPAWLASWNNTGISLVGDATFNVYSTPVPAGTVTLPGPGGADAYLVVVGCN